MIFRYKILFVLLSLSALLGVGCGKATPVAVVSDPLVMPSAAAVQTFPAEDLPYEKNPATNQLEVSFSQDVSVVRWPEKFSSEVGQPVLALSRLRDENFEALWDLSSPLKALELKRSGETPEAKVLRAGYFKWVAARQGHLDLVSKKLDRFTLQAVRKLVKDKKLATEFDSYGAALEALQPDVGCKPNTADEVGDASCLSALTLELLKAFPSAPAQKSFRAQFIRAIAARFEWLGANEELDRVLRAQGRPDRVEDFAAQTAAELAPIENEIRKIQMRIEGDTSSLDWSKWSLVNQNQKITQLIPLVLGLAEEQLSYPKVKLLRKDSGALSVVITQFNPCFTGGSVADVLDPEFSEAAGNLSDVTYEPRGGVLKFKFQYKGPGLVERVVQAREARPVRDESGQFLRDVRGNPLLDSVDLGVQKTLSIRCDGGTGEMTLKRARYRVLDQVVFQGDFTLRDRGSEIPRRGLIRMARNR